MQIYQVSGTRIVAFEPDQDNIQNDIKEDASQTLYMIDDHLRIYHMFDNHSGGSKFEVEVHNYFQDKNTQRNL
jgi:hypothetical protein